MCVCVCVAFLCGELSVCGIFVCGVWGARGWFVCVCMCGVWGSVNLGLSLFSKYLATK